MASSDQHAVPVFGHWVWAGLCFNGWHPLALQGRKQSVCIVARYPLHGVATLGRKMGEGERRQLGGWIKGDRKETQLRTSDLEGKGKREVEEGT